MSNLGKRRGSLGNHQFAGIRLTEQANCIQRVLDHYSNLKVNRVGELVLRTNITRRNLNRIVIHEGTLAKVHVDF